MERADLLWLFVGSKSPTLGRMVQPVPLLFVVLWLAQTANQPPPAPREFRGVWVATVSNLDWPSAKGLPVERQQAELVAIFEHAAALRLNAVIFQVRPSCCALYPSRYEPWSEYLTGRQGVGPDPPWDPLALAVEHAHRRGLELHAWFNPYRARHAGARSVPAAAHISRTSPALVRTYGKQLWLDPGEPQVQQHTLAVILDVVRRYDVDGVHIDDYFYPYPEGGVDFPDEPSWRAYRARNGSLARADWRRQNVDVFVQRLYHDIKRHKPWVKFGISPFGIYRPGMPPTIRAGLDQYNEIYADARKWLQEGWCDYFSPQLYWPINPPAQSFPVLLRWWVGENTRHRHVWPGLFTSKIGPEIGNWPMREITSQIQLTRRTPGASGHLHFSMRALSGNWKGLTDALRNEFYPTPALVPASPWLDAHVPARPLVRAAGRQSADCVFEWRGTPRQNIRWWVCYARYGQQWRLLAQYPPAVTTLHVPDRRESAPLTAFALSALGPGGLESERAIVPVPSAGR